MVHYKSAKYRKMQQAIEESQIDCKVWAFHHKHGRFPAPKEFKQICSRNDYITVLRRIQNDYLKQEARFRWQYIQRKFRLRQLAITIRLHTK